MKNYFLSGAAFASLFLIQIANSAEDVPTGSYSKSESGFYLHHFDRAPDLSGYLGKFEGNLFRGGQPNFNDGGDWLKKLQDNSISLVVDMRHEGADLTKEKTDLKNAGISYVLLPWHTDGTDQPTSLKVVERLFVGGVFTEHIENFPKVDASLRVLHLANDYLGEGKRIYVHCQRGEDRTGVFVSLLRNLDDNWKKEFANYGGSYYASLKKHREDIVKQLRKRSL
jgi:hypothetical protein